MSGLSRYLVFLSIAVTFVSSLPNRGVYIKSTRVTTWGEWGPWALCPNGTYVYGMQLKTEASQGVGDDSGLNGVKLFCGREIEDISYNKIYSTAIQSTEGDWGTWGKKYTCPTAEGWTKIQHAKGFHLRSEEYQGYQVDEDDTGANNLNMVCTEYGGASGKWLMGDGLGYGEWQEVQICPGDMVICGIKVQVEPFQGAEEGQDDTALNNVDMMCCYPV